MSVLHPFLEKFRAEHVSILTQLTLFTESPVQSRQFFEYCTKEVRPHFLKEELYLFDAIAKKPGIRAGGPMCVLYFDTHLNNPALNRSALACNEKQEQGSPEKMPDHLKTFYQTNSPVCIPVDEHFACEQILAKASEYIDLASTSANQFELSNLSMEYLKILRLHFEKEDNCLFQMCQSLLSTEELDELLSKSAI